MKFKCSKTSIYLIIELFLLYHIAFLRFLPVSNYITIQRVSSILLFIMILPYSIRCLRKMSVSIKVLVIMYMIIILISAVINRNELVMTNTLVGGVMYTVTFFELFVVFSYAVQKRSIAFVVKLFLRLTICYIVITDLLIIINPNMFLGGYYFIGNKFDVAYKHLELIALLLMNKEINSFKKKNNFIFYIKLFLIIGLTVIISYTVDTMTGLISVLIMGIILCFLKDYLIYSPNFFLLIILGAGGFIIFLDTILTWPLVQNFIVNILQRDLTLTGRMIIYDSIPKLIEGHLLFGYGYNSAYEVWTGYNMYMPNPQNGLINCIFEQGIFATIILVLLIRTIISKSNNSQMMRETYKPIITLIYVYTILAAIEITINVTFVGWAVLLYTITLIPDNSMRNVES